MVIVVLSHQTERNVMDAFLWVVTVAMVALLLGICYTCWNSIYWKRHGVRGPNGRPLVGNMFDFLCGRTHYGDVYERIYASHPKLEWIGIYRTLNTPAVLVRSQAMIKEVMIRNFQHFQDNVLWIDEHRDPIIWCNPFVARGAKWKEMRAEIVPIFTPNKVKMSFPHINAICTKLKAYVDANLANKNDGFEVKALFSKYTMDVVASAAYGLDAKSLSNTHSSFTKMVEHLFLPNPWSLLDTIALLFSPALGHLISYCYVPPTVQQWLRSMIGSVLDQRLGKKVAGTPSMPATDDDNKDKVSDFIQWLIEAKQKLHEPVDRDIIIGHCSTFLLEGFETSSSLMAFALYEYATNPHIQQRILCEIDEVLTRYNGCVCYEALQDMSYLEASLYETLRLHPPMAALLKFCTKPIVLPPQTPTGKPYTTRPGTVFVIPVQAVHRDPELYPDPLKFDPDRFYGPFDKQRTGCTFLGFGEGPRMCPGMRFGLAQSKAGLVTLLADYSVHLLPHKHPQPLKISPTTFLTAAKDGIWINFKMRK